MCMRYDGGHAAEDEDDAEQDAENERAVVNEGDDADLNVD